MFTSFIKSSPAYALDKIDCPEKRLFIAILSQAVHDAFADHVPRLEKEAARSFLTRNSSDFKHICEMAGRDAAYVKERIRKTVLREKGWNADLSLRTQPRRIRKQKHLTGNAYYAAKRKESHGNAISMD
tara:strand:+ start:159 stop:545 length:387 start_codon:yes stop_codon:yes gene_type:complete